MLGRGALVRSACALVLVTGTLVSCARKAPINRPGRSGSVAASQVDGVQQVTLTAGDDYRFHPSTFSVHPGKVRVILHNTGQGAPHNLLVVGFPADFVPLASAGQTMAATFTAPPVKNGTSTRYRFECTIHVKDGQVGTMIVTAG